MEFSLRGGLFITITVFLVHRVLANDNPCVRIDFLNRSSVCVCNATYCDTVTRETPVEGKYFVYTTSAAGRRFMKRSYYMHPLFHSYHVCINTLQVDPSVTYQTVEGFGGAVTDSAAYNWMNLKDQRLKQNLIDSYFSEYGIEYNMLRVPIGGTDFSLRPYAYNELPEGDVKLQNFTLAPEDIHLKIPFIKACQNVSVDDIHVLAATWSPPQWMKDTGKLVGYSRLKREYYQTYADYHCKFIQKYQSAGIPIWAISTTNEPSNGLLNLSHMNSLGWTVRGLGEWIQENLGPTIRNKCPGSSNVKIISGDDQRLFLPFWFNLLITEHIGALDYIDGVGVHYYLNGITPAELIKTAMSSYPGKFVIATEASEGANDRMKVDFGSWERAENYAIDIIENLMYNVVGWIDWNLCLNMNGGPSWVDNHIDSAIIVNPDKGEFYKQPMFYIIGHFSKFLPRGSKRIRVTETVHCGFPVQYVGFLTPESSVVVIIYNSGGPRVVMLQLQYTQAAVHLDAKSITTVEFPNENGYAHNIQHNYPISE